MTDTYDKFFSVKFRHNYYADGNCSDFIVSPDANTSQFLKSQGFVVRNGSEGFSVFSKSKRGGEGSVYISDHVKTNGQLNFILSIQNPYLLNVTAFSENNLGEAHLFASWLSKANIDGSEVLFEMGQAVFLHSHLLIPEGTLNKQDKLETAEGIIKLDSETTGDQVAYKTEGIDAGVYGISGTDPRTYIFVKFQSPTIAPFAVLSIDMNDGNILDDAGKLLQPNFVLQMHSVRSFWQYNILQNEKKDNLIIETSGDKYGFSKSEGVTPDKRPMLVFTSDQEIPIMEISENDFRLKERNGDPENDLVLISNLPTPSQNSLNRKVDGKIYTPIYVNF